MNGAGRPASAALKHNQAKHSRPYPRPLSRPYFRPISGYFPRSNSRPVPRPLSVSSHREVCAHDSPFVLSIKLLPIFFLSCPHPAVNKREYFPMPSLGVRHARRSHPVPRGAFWHRVCPWITCAWNDMAFVYVCHVWNSKLFSLGYVSTPVTGACPVTTDLIVRVHVRTTTTI